MGGFANSKKKPPPSLEKPHSNHCLLIKVDFFLEVHAAFITNIKSISMYIYICMYVFYFLDSTEIDFTMTKIYSIK